MTKGAFIILAVFLSFGAFADYRSPYPNEVAINDIYGSILQYYSNESEKRTFPGKNCSIKTEIVLDYYRAPLKFVLTIENTQKNMTVTVFGGGKTYFTLSSGTGPSFNSGRYTCLNVKDKSLLQTSCAYSEENDGMSQKVKIVSRLAENDLEYWQVSGGEISGQHGDKRIKIEKLKLDGSVLDSLECQFQGR